MHARWTSVCAALVVAVLLALGHVASTPASVGAPQDPAGALFSAGPASDSRPDRAADPTVMRRRQVHLNLGALGSPDAAADASDAGAEVTLNLFDDLTYTAVRDRVDRYSDGWVWVGHVPGLDKSAVTLSVVDGVMSGSLVSPAGTFSIRPQGSPVHEVAQIDQGAFPQELDPVKPVIEAAAARAASEPRAEADGPAVAGDDGSRIDVMVLYTSAARTQAGGAAGIASRINLGISETNTSYANSSVVQRVRLVHTAAVSYTENNNLATDLYNLSNYNGSSVISTALGNTAASLRNTHAADIVTLLTAPAAPDGCGIAWVMENVVAGFAPYAFNVVEEGCVSPNYSFAHELGHNMGLQHDWYVNNDIVPYTYAHGFVSLASGNRFRTIMSYNDLCVATGGGCTRVLYWSNPSVTYNGAAMGIAAGTKSNCPTGSTTNYLCDAHDRGALNNTRTTVANFRTENAAVAPTITNHPDSVTVLSGATVTFSSSGTGTPTPTYQWQRYQLISIDPLLFAWLNISGQQASSYTFTATAGGTYRVVYTNSAGSVNSNSATVTIGSAPAITTQPTDQHVTAGVNATFTAAASGVPAPTVQWQRYQIISISPITFGWVNVGGATSSTFTITAPTTSLNGARYRAVYTNTFGSAATNEVRLYVTDIARTPTTLRFAATKAGAAGALVSNTPAQTVLVVVTGQSVGWTATSNRTWAVVTGGTGTGDGSFSVSLANPGNVIAGSTALSGTITITPNVATVSAVTIPVNLTVDQTGGTATSTPFGLVDTPAQNSLGWTGSLAVTGWVLDDVGVASVKLYRNCLAFEPPANCQTVLGRTVVYVGDATLVSGARTDIEGLYPTYPMNYRAAWGYLLLTNLLPHIPNTQMFGGQGSMVFHPLATDVEGKQVWLGRTIVDSVPTTFGIANDSIAKPFGAIDTPAQGATISGNAYANFGWALTPDSNTVGGEGGDILVPTNGSTLQLYIDGAVSAGTITYNQCRGSIAGPMTAGNWCNDDVASIFGNPTPQPTLTTRSANPTKHRNLDIGRGAIGAVVLNTNSYTNGVHTIMWGVTDSASRGEGLGSRYFTVLNAGARPDGDARPADTAAGDGVADALRDAPARVRGEAADVERLPRAAVEVQGRSGVGLDAPFVPMAADEQGVFQAQLDALGRLELALGRPVEAAYLVANGTLRDLPPGSRVDEAGTFTWAPGVGYLGTYRLAFVAGGAQIPVDVTVRPATPVRDGQAVVRMALDAPLAGASVSGPFTVAGWALDPEADLGAGIDAVHVWAQRVDVPGQAPVFLGVAALHGARPDVARAFGRQFGHAAFSLTTDGTLAPGTYDVTAYVWNRRTARWEDARSAIVTAR